MSEADLDKAVRTLTEHRLSDRSTSLVSIVTLSRLLRQLQLVCLACPSAIDAERAQ